jgi:uncharacterized protein (DUF488 family)
MKLFTIGFTKTSAKNFFHRLRSAHTTKLLDVRLNNVSQLAGFAKKDDLKFFCQEIVHIDYEHRPDLAPTQRMLDEFKKEKGSWQNYAEHFLQLMAQRKVEELDHALFDGACLLCSEDKPHHCHRRLIAEYLKAKWEGVEIVHL